MSNFPVTSHEPIVPRTIGASSGSSPAVPYSTTVAAGHVTEQFAFPECPIIITVQNKHSVALVAGDDFQVQTSGNGFTDVTELADLLFDLTGLGPQDLMSFEVSGPPGQPFRLKNTSAQNLAFGIYIKPN